MPSRSEDAVPWLKTAGSLDFYHGSPVGGLKKLEPGHGITEGEHSGQVFFSSDPAYAATYGHLPEYRGHLAPSNTNGRWAMRVPEGGEHMLEHPVSLYTIPWRQDGRYVDDESYNAYDQASRSPVDVSEEKRYSTLREALAAHDVPVEVVPVGSVRGGVYRAPEEWERLEKQLGKGRVMRPQPVPSKAQEKIKSAQGFEFAEVGPNAGETGWDPPAVWKPGRLMKRSEYEDVAVGLNADAVRGVKREPEEKVSNFDDTIFSGDPTALMGQLRSIHKMGMASSGSIGIEDVDALGQSPGTVRPRQVQRAMSDQPADPGPGYGADNSTLGVAPSEPEGDGHGDIPIEEPTGQNSSKEIFRRNIRGFSKTAEPPPPPGMSAARWDKILEGGPKQGEEELPPVLSQMIDKKPVTEVTDLIQKLEKRARKSCFDEAVREADKNPHLTVIKGAPFKGSGDSAHFWLEDKRGRIIDPTAHQYPKETRIYTGGTPVDLSKNREAVDRALQKRAYALQGHTNVQGLPIAIENRAGSVRSGKTEDGHEWRTKMKFPYGYIKGTKGADGDPVDVYVGPEKEAPDAFVVHQHKVDGTGYDEDKVMLGFPSKKEAKEAYLAHYDDPKFLGPISRVSVERLKELVESKKQLTKISRASWSALLQELQKLGEDEGVLAPQEPRGGRLLELVRKAGPGIGAGLGAGAGALLGLKRGKLLSHTLAGMGTGATLGWTPDLYHSAREAIEKYRSGQ